MSKLREIAMAVAVVLLGVLTGPQDLLAQGNSAGAIHGTLTDSTGALLPGVTVTITNMKTNVSETITTGNDGTYDSLNLPVSTYLVRADKQGFGTRLNENIEVNPGETAVVDIVMAVGSVTQSVDVQGTVAPITEDKADRSTVIEADTLARLPLLVNGSARLVDSFLTLAPGVTGDTFIARINGGPSFSQDFYYDGIPYMNADGGGRQEALGAPFESVDEYAINTNAYSAVYGRGAGLLNFHIRSGTNQFHGGAYEYLRNNDLDARGFFSANAPTEKQDEFGFKIGGPVWIPKVYDGKDKTFFFFNADWYKFRGGLSNSTLTLPTTAERAGDFSALLDSNPAHSLGINPCDGTSIQPGQIFDPNTTRTINGVECRTAFPGNKIPANRESQLSAQYIGLIPAAGSSAVVNNTLLAVPTAPINNLTWILKIDHSFSKSIVLHASYYKGNEVIPTSPSISGPLGSGNNFNGLAWEPRASLDYTITPHILNQVGFSWQYTEGTRAFYPLVPSSFNSPIATAGLPYPAIDIAGEPQYGSGLDNNQNSGGCWPCVFFSDNLKWVKGRHTLTFGTELRAEDERDAFAVNIGTYSFNPQTTSIPGFANAGELGSGFASFYLGTPSGISRTGSAPPRLVRTGYRALYVQDDFHVSPKLTVNLGLRWDVSLPAWAKNGYFSTFDPSVPNPGAGGLLGSLVYAGMSGGSCIAQGGASLCRDKIANTYYNNFQPRVGFAYRLTDKTVVRGGFGMATVRGGASTLMGPEIAASYLTGYQYQDTLTSPDGGYSVPTQINGTWDSGIPPIGAAPARTRSIANGQPVQLMRPQDGQPGYIQNWSLTVERQMPWRIGLEGSYVGSSSARLGANLLNVNQTPAQYLSLGPLLLDDIYSPQARAAGIPIPYTGFTGSVAQALRPFPQYQYIADNTENTGHQDYHSLQLRAQKYFSDGLTFLVSYTWSKTLTDTVDQFSTFGGGPLNNTDWKAEKRILGGTVPTTGLNVDQAPPQALSIASTYELPIGPGKRFLGSSPALGRVVGGWGVSAVLSYNAGSALPIFGGTANPIFNGTTRPNIVQGVPQKLYNGGKFDPATQLYLNPNAFSDAGAFALGDAPVTLPNARGFPFYNENISLIKDIKIWETAKLQFRAEGSNVFNRVVFGEPDTNWNDRVTNSFGRVTSQVNLPRILQLALRVDF